MLPFVVHLAAEMCTFEWLDRLRNKLIVAQMLSGWGRIASSNWAVWIMMLGRGTGLRFVFVSEGVFGVSVGIVECEFEWGSGGGVADGLCNLDTVFCSV